jgi:hypothetical protein
VRALASTAATPVWLVLMLATGLSWWLGAEHEAGRAASGVVMAIAFTKVGFIGMYFQELRHAPLALRLLFCTWCVVVCGAVLGIFLVGR